VSESPLVYPTSSAKKRSLLAKGPGVPTVYLVRHGDTAMNSGHTSPEKFRSHIDVPLSAEGVQEGKDLANKLCPMGVDRIYSSDLQRAEDTAKSIAKVCEAKVTTDKRLRPWDLGQLAGTPVKQGIAVINKYVKTPKVPMPGGESFDDFREDFLDVLDEIFAETAKEGGHTVVVTHTRDLQLTKASEAVPGGFSNHDISVDVFEDYSDEVGTGDIMVVEFQNGKWDITDQEEG